MVSDDSIFNQIPSFDDHHQNVVTNDSKVSIRRFCGVYGLGKMNRHPDNYHDKENFRVLQNISNINNHSLVSEQRKLREFTSQESSNSSAEKRLRIKHRRFERRPNFNTNKSEDSSIHWSSVQHAMSESNLHDLKKDGKENAGVVRLNNKINLNVHNRNMSNPSQICTPDSANKSIAGPIVAASSRLVFNRQEVPSKVSSYILTF